MERHDSIAGLSRHATDLSVLPLVECDAEFLSFTHDFVGASNTVWELHSLLPIRHLALGKRSLEFNDVFFFRFELRMRTLIDKVAVVGKQKKSARFFVETSHRL